MIDGTKFVAWGFDDNPSKRCVDDDSAAVTHVFGTLEPPEDSDGLIVFVSKAKTRADKVMRIFNTMRDETRPIVFVVPEHYELKDAGGTIWDAFFHFLNQLQIVPKPGSAAANLTSRVPEFEQLFKLQGVARVFYDVPGVDPDHLTVISGNDHRPTSFIVGQQLFFLPAVTPTKGAESTRLATLTAACVRDYLARVTTSVPDWARAFPFAHETELQFKLDSARQEAESLESDLNVYRDRKGLLVWHSDPLVAAVAKVLRDDFSLRVTVSEHEKKEDAVVEDEVGTTIAAVEIKGVSKNFRREDVNQVDNNRERRRLPGTTPGILICNTFRNTRSLEEKDTRPHHETVEHAMRNNVLMIRTLDLLRYLDLVERGVLDRGSLLERMLHKAGWMRVEGDTVEIVED